MSAKVYLSMTLRQRQEISFESNHCSQKRNQKGLGDRIRNQARIVPELVFVIDEVEENAQRMEDLIKSLNIPRKKNKPPYSCMNLSLFIARRYFFSKRKKNFINIISVLSMVGVAFSTAALIIVLSVFNGFEGLLRGLKQGV